MPSIEAAQKQLLDDFAAARSDGKITVREIARLVIDVAYLGVAAGRSFADTAKGRAFAIGVITDAVEVVYPQILAISWLARVLAWAPKINLKVALLGIGQAIVDRELPPPPEPTPTPEVKS